MTQLILEKKISKTAEQLQELVVKSKRKLLELEVMLNMNEIRRGQFETFKTAAELFRGLK